MDNYDILKFKTFHNYNFDDIESSEFLDLFYKLVNVNDESDENAMEFEDQNKKTNEFSSEKKKEFDEEKSNKNEQEMSEDEHFQNQNAFLKTTVLPFIQANHNSYTLLKNKFSENEMLFKNLIDKIKNIVPKTDYNGQCFYQESKESLNLTNDLFPINNTDDPKDYGNCLYNTFSLILFGVEEFFFIIKLCSIFVLLENEDFFKKVMKTLKYEYSFEKLICSSCVEKEYGNELNIFSISVLLNRKILLYNICIPTFYEKKEGKSVSAFNNRVIFWINNDLEPTVMGQDGPHFFPILKDKKIQPELLKINRDQIFYYDHAKNRPIF
jgi:hypothetical protein